MGGLRAWDTVLGAERTVVLGMRAQNVDLHERVAGAGDAPYETVFKRQLVPFYAAHLAEPGSVVPCVVRDGRADKVRVGQGPGRLAGGSDRRPGRGPPARGGARRCRRRTRRRPLVAGAPAADWSDEALAAEDPGSEAGVAFSTWVAVEAGLVR